MSEDPFDSFVDLQMIDDTMNSLNSAPAPASPAISAGQLPENTSGLSLPQWDAITNTMMSSATTANSISASPITSELLKLYLQGQLSLMETNPSAAVAAAAAVAEVAAAAAVAANRLSIPANTQATKNVFNPYTSNINTSVSASLKREPDSSLNGFSPVSGMLSYEPSPWMNQLLQPSSLSAAPAVEPCQLLLNPSKSSNQHNLLDEEVKPIAKPIGSQNVMRRHSHKSSQSDPYPTYTSISESSAQANGIATATATATSGTNGTTVGRINASTKFGNIRSLSRRNSTKMSDRSSASHSDEDIEDEDMVNELLSLRDGVVKHGLQSRRVPLPDEETIRKMTPKERRQLRNKISARNFRLRRKEYIGTLEAEVKEVRIELDDYRTRCNDVEMENQALKKELRSMHDQLEMALAAAASVNLTEINNSISSTFDKALLPSNTTLCTPVSPTASYATATTPELLMMSPSASPSTPCYSSFNSTFDQKRQALCNTANNTPMITRSSSPAPMSASPRLTLHAEDIHQNCSSANGSAVSHVNWSKNRLIVH